MQLIEAIQDAAWAVRPSKLDEITAFITARANGEPIEAALKAAGKSGSRDGYELLDGVAVIEIIGTISKRMNMLSDFSGGTSSELLRRDVAAALADPDVSAILLDIESPGGSVDGTKELADFIFESRGRKPIIAFANGLMASAAYWIGSAADAIIASETAIVGSIGVAMTHFDKSAADASQGVKKTEIYAGKYKRLASSTKPLTEEGMAYLQDMVDTYYGMFIEAVARNRGVPVEKALAMADGREFIGKQALEVGLVDILGTKENALGTAKERGSKSVDINTLREKHPDLFAQVKAMGADEAMQAAKAEGIKDERARVAEILSADGDPVVTAECITKGLDIGASMKALMIAEKNGRASKLEALAKSAPPSVGQELPQSPAAKTTFEAEVEKLIVSGKTRGEATRIVTAEQPALHAEYVERISQKGA